MLSMPFQRSALIFLYFALTYGGELKLTQTLSNLHCSGRDGSIGGDIAVSPNGKWLAASNRGENNIVLYEIDGNGAIYYYGTVKTDGWARILRFDAASEYLLPS